MGLNGVGALALTKNGQVAPDIDSNNRRCGFVRARQPAADFWSNIEPWESSSVCHGRERTPKFNQDQIMLRNNNCAEILEAAIGRSNSARRS